MIFSQVFHVDFLKLMDTDLELVDVMVAEGQKILELGKGKLWEGGGTILTDESAIISFLKREEAGVS